jgi:hypothetical protein
MADYFDSKKFGTVMVLGPFTRANITASQTNVDLVCGQSTTVTVPYAGSVIAVAASTTEGVTGGSCIIRAHKASTEFTPLGYPAPTLNTTNTSGSYASIRPGAITFSAGDRLGLSIVTDATFTPATCELDGWLYVQLNPT